MSRVEDWSVEFSSICLTTPILLTLYFSQEFSYHITVKWQKTFVVEVLSTSCHIPTLTLSYICHFDICTWLVTCIRMGMGDLLYHCIGSSRWNQSKPARGSGCISLYSYNATQPMSFSRLIAILHVDQNLRLVWGDCLATSQWNSTPLLPLTLDMYHHTGELPKACSLLYLCPFLIIPGYLLGPGWLSLKCTWTCD